MCLDLSKRPDEAAATLADHERLHRIGQGIHDAHAAVAHRGGLGEGL